MSSSNMPNTRKPTVGTPAHYEFLGVPESRLEALKLPSRMGDKLVYPRFKVACDEYEAAKREAQASAERVKAIQERLRLNSRPQLVTIDD